MFHPIVIHNYSPWVDIPRYQQTIVYSHKAGDVVIGAVDCIAESIHINDDNTNLPTATTVISWSCSLYNVHYTVYSVHCTYCTLYNVEVGHLLSDATSRVESVPLYEHLALKTPSSNGCEYINSIDKRPLPPQTCLTYTVTHTRG